MSSFSGSGSLTIEDCAECCDTAAQESKAHTNNKSDKWSRNSIKLPKVNRWLIRRSGKGLCASTGEQVEGATVAD